MIHSMVTIAEHVAAFPADARADVQRIYDIARRLAPTAQEGVSYGVPCLKVDGKPFCAVQKAARHLSLIPFSSAAIASAAAVLDAIPTTKGSAQFTATTPLPDSVVEAILGARLLEIRS